MASRTVIEHIDDLDGSPAVATRRFALDGVSYEIDLNEKNNTDLDSTFTRWITAGRRTGGGSRRGRPSVARPRSDRSELATIRAWAKGQGLDVADRGRISEDVRGKYAAAH